MAILNGVYLFKEHPSAPDKNYDLDFYAWTLDSSERVTHLKVSRQYNQTMECLIEYDGQISTNLVYRGLMYGWVDDGYRTLELYNETVPDDFYTWFTANATFLYEYVTIGGTWRWNEVVNGIPGYPDNQIVFNETVNATITTSGRTLQRIHVRATGSGAFDITYIGTDVGGSGIDYDEIYIANPSSPGVASGWQRKGYRTVTFPAGTSVKSTFYNWFVGNALRADDDFHEISGRWKWNATPEYHTRDFEEVKINFKSGFTDADCLIVKCNSSSLSTALTYSYPSADAVVYGANVTSSTDVTTPGWRDESHRFIDLGTAPQKVTSEFYDWFTANAKKQTLVEISGVWKFNHTLSLEIGLFEPVDFRTVVGGTDYQGMYMFESKVSGADTLCYSTSTLTMPFVIHGMVYGNSPSLNSWTRELTDNTVDFGASPKLVSSEFYNWFTANASRPTYKIGGTWMWKEKPTFIDGHIMTIEFLSQGVMHASLSIGPDGTGSQVIDTIKYDNIVVYDGTSWVNDGYRTITFSLDGQLVTEEFYNWFMDNVEDLEFLIIEKRTLVEIADAIRAKTGKTDEILVSRFKDEIASITVLSGKVITAGTYIVAAEPDYWFDNGNDPMRQELEFESNGSTFSSIDFDPAEHRIYYDGVQVAENNDINGNAYFPDSAYRTIIVHKDQAVSDGFYSWWTNNTSP